LLLVSDDNRSQYLSGSASPVVVTLAGWLMAIGEAGLFALSPPATAKVVDVLRYEQLFYFYMVQRYFWIFA